MSWFVFALVCTLGWGFADLFYKQASEEEERYSHLKIAVWVALVMGVCSCALLLFSSPRMTLSDLVRNAARYAPASLSYILSMVIGYAGLRYLELSIVSPVQNASGALSAVCMLVYFAAKGTIASVSEEFSALDLTGTALIVAGVLLLAFVEKRLSDSEPNDKKYRFGALALLFPILYCVFDTVGTAADGILLEGETGLALSETEVLILYGLTFFLAGVVCMVILRVKTGRWYDPFARQEGPKALAACCEEFGQVFYVWAMAAKPVLAAPMVASYCIVSVLLSRVFLKEKLRAPQYVCVALVIAGIVLLGISEGLSEL